MPLSRYRIRDEYSLADPELYRAVDKDDSGALLEGVAMAGLVGVLRQLGDLAEFAAEIFHDLHEEVMVTAARGHSLTVRVQQLEEELPLIEKEFLSRTNQSSFFYNAGTGWHPNLPLDQNMVTRGDLPRHVMESYEECRGPPRLFLLDKFDVAGAGSCLKRYTDPSFFKREASYIKISNIDVQRETKARKAKQKKGSRSKNGKTPELLPTSHAKLHQLLLEERNETGGKDSEHHVKLKRRLNGFPFDSKTEKSYMEKLLETPSVGQKTVHEVFVDSLSLKLPSRVASETGLDIVENSAVNVNEEVAVGINEEVTWTNRNTSPSPSQSEDTVAPVSPNDALNEITTYDESLEISNQSLSVEAGCTLPTFHNVSTDGEISVDGDRQDTTSGYQSDDISSDIDDYMDAPTSMESELDSESEMNPNKDLHVKSSKFSATNDERLQSESSDSLSIRNSMLSDDENGSSKKEISSFFNSGSSSTSPEMAHSEGEVAAKDFAIAGSRVQMCDSHLQTTDDGFSSAQPLEDAFDNDTCAKTAGINRQSSDFGETMTRSTIPGLVSISGYADEEAIVIKDALTEPVRNEIFSTLGECENDYVYVVENAANPSAPRTSEVQGRTGDDPPTRVSDENQDEIINNHATSAVNPDNVSSNAGDDIPIPLSTDNEHECNLDVGHLNPSNNLSVTSSIFNHLSQNRDELFSAKNGLLDRLNDKGPNFVENSTCLHKLSDSPSSNKDDHSSSSSVISYSSDGKDQNISTDASLHVPNTLDVSLEECAKDSLQIVSEEESAETNHSGASYDIPVCSNLSITQAEIGSVGSILEIETDNASLKYNERLTNAIPNGAEQRELDVIHVVDCPTNHDYVETHISAEEDTFLPFDSGERGISQIGQECLDEVLSARTGETMDHIAYGYPESVSEEPVVLNATMTEAYQLNGGDATGSVDSTDDVKVNASSYMDIKKFQDDSISCSGQFTQNKLQNASLCFPGSHKELDKLNVGHHAITSPISDSVSHDIAGYSSLQCNVLPSDLDKVTCVATGQSVLDMEPISSSANNLTNVIRERIPCENLDKGCSDDALSLPTHHCIEENVELAHIQLDEGLVGKGEGNNELSPLQERTQVLERTVAISSRLMPESLPSQPSVSKLSSQDSNSLDLDKDPRNPLTCMSPGFALLPGNNQISPEEMPPLPPLPPVQWRLGKVQLASPALERNVAQHDTGLLSTYQSKIDQTVQPLEQIFPPVIAKEGSPDFYESAAYNMEHSGPLSLPVSHAVLDENSDDSFSFPTTTHSLNPHLSFSGPDSDNLHTSLVQKRGTLDPLYSIPQVISVDNASMLDIGTSPEELIQPAQQAAEETVLKVQELEEGYKCSEGNLATNDRIRLQESSEDSGSTGDSKSVEKEETQSLEQVAPETSLNELKLQKHDTSLEANFITTDAIPSALTVENEKPLHAIRDSEVEIVQPALEDGIVNGSQKVKHPGVQNPSIETVAAFDRSRLRKVTDQVKNQARKVDERDSLLELIRTKSFNLRPTAAARPNIQGPQTNLRVVAILERAKTIRQAFAGSDEDDNEDSWSDS